MEKSLPKGSAPFAVRYGLAFSYLYEGQPDPAIRALETYLAEYKDSGSAQGFPEVFIWLGRVSVLDGHWALRRDACAVVVAAEEPRSPREAAFEPLLASLRAQFTQVEIARAAEPADEPLRALAATLPRSSHDWCLVVPSCRARVAAGLVNALFRRRENVEAVVLRDDFRRPRLPIGLYHRDLLARVSTGLHADPSRTPGLAALGRVRELALVKEE